MEQNAGLKSFLDDTFTTFDRVLEGHRADLKGREVGTVNYIGLGIARLEGLPGVKSEELVRFTGDVLGMVFNVDPSEVGVILLGESQMLKAGSEVRRTGRVLDVPVGEGLIGRVLDPMGRALARYAPQSDVLSNGKRLRLWIAHRSLSPSRPGSRWWMP
jgi:F-type H+-transporting ATPase subunit alpha